MRKILFIASMLLFLVTGFSQETQEVEGADTVLERINGDFNLKNFKFYNEIEPQGKGLQTAELMWDFLFPEEASNAEEVSPDDPSKKLKKYYELSLDYGVEYLLTKQNSLVGELETKGWVPNLVSLSFFTALNDFGLEARIQVVPYKWETQAVASTGSFPLWRIYLGGKWKLLTLRFEYNDEPLYKLFSLTTAEGTTQTTGWLMAGISELSPHRPPIWKYSLLVGVPLFTTAKGVDEDLENKWGFKINLEGSYNRQLAKWENSELLFSIFAGIYYQKQKFGNAWQEFSGTNDLMVFKTDLIAKIIYSF